MIDPLLEEILPLAEAARRLPRLRAGRPTHPSTLWRWASRGIRGVRLETVRVGGTCCTIYGGTKALFRRAERRPRPHHPRPVRASH